MFLQGKPTGFEEYNADGPLTVEESKQDNDLYNLDFPFVVRIMTAIQRFEARRKMTSEQRDIFYKYLAYGGIDVGPNMFQGLSASERKQMEREDLITALAQTSISDDKWNIGSEDSIWVVDFKGVMQGFLSRRALELWEMQTFESVKTITNVFSNFMSYLLLHEVCPEYASDILSTRTFLDKVATLELWNTRQAERWLPGDFNIACSTLFGGFYAQNYDGHTNWSHPEDTNVPDHVFVGMTDEEARNVAKFAIAAAASEEQALSWVRHANANTVKIEWKQEGAFEITKVFPVTLETKQFYKTESPGFRPVGRILARKWENPDAKDEDLTEAEKQAQEYEKKAALGSTAMTKFDPESNYDYEFFLEAQVLQYCYPGMKIEATIYKLNCGIMFFDTFVKAYCSFDTFLPNYLMLDYTKPRAVGVKAEEEAAKKAEEDWQAEKVQEAEGTEDWSDEAGEQDMGPEETDKIEGTVVEGQKDDDDDQEEDPTRAKREQEKNLEAKHVGFEADSHVTAEQLSSLNGNT